MQLHRAVPAAGQRQAVPPLAPDLLHDFQRNATPQQRRVAAAIVAPSRHHRPRKHPPELILLLRLSHATSDAKRPREVPQQPGIRQRLKRRNSGVDVSADLVERRVEARHDDVQVRERGQREDVRRAEDAGGTAARVEGADARRRRLGRAQAGAGRRRQLRLDGGGAGGELAQAEAVRALLVFLPVVERGDGEDVREDPVRAAG